MVSEESTINRCTSQHRKLYFICDSELHFECSSLSIRL
jgi:hypothetical protein